MILGQADDKVIHGQALLAKQIQTKTTEETVGVENKNEGIEEETEVISIIGRASTQTGEIVNLSVRETVRNKDIIRKSSWPLNPQIGQQNAKTEEKSQTGL